MAHTVGMLSAVLAELACPFAEEEFGFVVMGIGAFFAEKVGGMDDTTAMLVEGTVFFVEQFVEHHEVEDITWNTRIIEGSGDHHLIMAREIMAKDAGGGLLTPT